MDAAAVGVRILTYNLSKFHCMNQTVLNALLYLPINNDFIRTVNIQIYSFIYFNRS